MPVAENGEAFLAKPVEESAALLGESSPRLAVSPDSEGKRVLVADFGAHAQSQSSGCQMQTRGTRLFLVLCCLEFSDLLFAVAAVSAIVAQLNDLFLACKSLKL